MHSSALTHGYVSLRSLGRGRRVPPAAGRASRWQIGVTETELNPLSPWCGEPKSYTLSSPGQPALELHPTRVLRFLGNPLPDPSVAGALWSDSVLQALYDAVHAAALSLAGATSLLHEAKVDVVTVPNLSEHLSSVETTEQLSARFAYAAAMKSMNNLLLLGDGESWARQSVDFAGLPEMAHLPADGGGRGRHPRNAPARAVAGGPVGDGRERRPELLRHDRGAAESGALPLHRHGTRSGPAAAAGSSGERIG